MQTPSLFDPMLSELELRGVSRTVAEIEWLLLILVMLYQVVLVPDPETGAALMMAMFLFAAFVLAFHYVNFYRRETHWKIAIETWVMIAFITWVLAYTGGAASPLSDLYILVIVVSALSLGKVVTLLELALIAVCFIWLSQPQQAGDILTLEYGTRLLAQLAPMVLVGYITTMLSADIRRAYGHSYGQMKQLSETDDLTGALNTRGFALAADELLRQSERYGLPFSVLMIDSDSLKTVNDTLGHEAGDRLLKLIVQCIQKELRKSPGRKPDIIARHGGDEFLLLLPETPASGAVGVAERIRRSIQSTPVTARGQSVEPTVSIGIACYPTHGSDMETLLRKADQAMYASKSAGKNRITLFSA
jgi:diguanylate cyclase (GGDEF)-like protein